MVQLNLEKISLALFEHIQNYKKTLKENNPWLPTDYTRNLASSAKARTDDLVRRAKDQQIPALIPTEGPAVDWYESLAHLTWSEAKEKFLKQIAR